MTLSALTLHVVIGVGRGIASPSLRTGLADLPHPALQSVVLPARGLTNQGHGLPASLSTRASLSSCFRRQTGRPRHHLSPPNPEVASSRAVLTSGSTPDLF